MTAVVKFPSYWGPKDGDPVLVRDALWIEEGWVEHFGRYNDQTGQWEAAEAPKRPAKEAAKPSLFGKSKEALLQIAEDEGVAIPAGAKAREIQAAIKAAR